MAKRIKLNEAGLKKIIKETIIGEVSREDVMPSKYYEVFKNRVINAMHGGFGNVKKMVKDFYKEFRTKVPKDGFTFENLMDLADKIEERERSGEPFTPGAREAGNGFFEPDAVGGDSDAFGRSFSGRFDEGRKSVRLNESQLKKIIKESVKRVLKEGLPKLPGYDAWKLSTPKEWDEPDMIDKSDFYDMIRSASDSEAREFIEWLEGYDKDVYRTVMEQMNSGEENSPFYLALDNGIDWEDIAREFFDIKPVNYYPGDMDESKNATKGKIKLSETQFKKIIKESVKKALMSEISSDLLKHARDKFSDKYGSSFHNGEMTDKLEKDQWGNPKHPKDGRILAKHYQDFDDAIHNAKYDEERNDPDVKKAAEIWDKYCSDAEWDDEYECDVLEVGGWTFWGDMSSPDAQIEFEGPDGESGSFRASKINRMK